MLSRILVAIVGIPLLVYILYFGGFPLFIFTEIIALIGTYEFYKMAEASHKKPNRIVGMILAFCIPIIIYLGQMYKLRFGLDFLITFAIIICILIKVFQNKVEDASIDIGETLLGAIYPSLLFSYVIMISFLPNGGKWLLTAQIMVWVCDSFAYFTGLSIGRKIWNRGFSQISPKKSIEGSLGGILFTILSLGILDKIFILVPEGLSYIEILIMGLFIALVAQIGDLGESLFKREFKIKDSGKILAGHGGILDRFDSMLFVAPVMYYLLKLVIL